MNKITLFGKEYELAYTVGTMRRIEKRCGDVANLGEWLNSDIISEKFAKVCLIVGDLINGAIQKHNCEVALGLADGEKKEFLSEEAITVLPDILSIEDLVSLQTAMINTMNGAEDVDIPDNSDPDLADVESVKKN